MKKLLIFILMCIFSFYTVSATVIIEQPGDDTITILTGNLTSFISLTDTPGSYSGQGGLCVKVNGGETALEFGACATGIANNTAGWILNFTTLYSLDWTNVTITESQISDLVHTTDSSAFVNCSGTEVLLGNGSCQNSSVFIGNGFVNTGVFVNCTGAEVGLGNGSCQNSSVFLAAGGNASFNQSLTDGLYAPNTTTGIQLLINDTNAFFTGVISLNWTNVTITESQILDLVHTTDSNAFVNCSGGEIFMGNGSCQNTSLYLVGETDTSAFVNCSGMEAFLGNGSCQNLSVYIDTNITDTSAFVNCSGGEIFMGNGSCQNTSIYLVGETDTSAFVNCSGSEAFLGNGSCQNLSVYIDTNITDTSAFVNCTGSEAFLGNGSCQNTSLYLVGETDTSSFVNCTGAEVFLGNGTCQNTSAIGTGTNCNATGTCSGGDVAYMNFANVGNFNASNISLGDGVLHMDIFFNGTLNLFNTLGFNAFFTDNLTAAFFKGDGSLLTNIVHTTDSNAFVNCSGSEAFLGNGSCQNTSLYLVGETDTSAFVNCSGAEIFMGNGSCQNTSLYLIGETDTSASVNCTGAEVFLGNGTCQNTSTIGTGIANNTRGWTLNISELYPTYFFTINNSNRWNMYDTGDDMVLNVTNGGGDFEIMQDNSKIILFNTPSAANDFKVMQVFSQEATDVTEFTVTKAGDNLASYFVRSLSVAGNASTMPTPFNCSTYTNFIDCKTDVTGADFFVQDDIEAGGSLFIGGAINATNWLNVSILEAQISDLVHTTDSNAFVNCSGSEIFLGNGSCGSSAVYLDDTNCNATGTCSSGNVAYLNYSNAGGINISTKSFFLGDVCYDEACTSLNNATGRYWSGGTVFNIFNGSGILIQG